VLEEIVMGDGGTSTISDLNRLVNAILIYLRHGGAERVVTAGAGASWALFRIPTRHR
jgi:hypothetical protein